MHIYYQCNFWATILHSTCVVISDLLSVSCATVARKNLITWCKQRDFFSRMVGARFMSISKPFINMAGLYIGDRSRIWLLGSLLTQWRKITVRYGSNLWWQPVFCHSDRWLCCDMHVDRKRPHLTADQPSKTRAVLLKPYWHPEFWSSFINKHSLFRQTEAVVHCQIQQQTITCCHAELSLSNHTYMASWISGKIWKVIIWGPFFALEKCGSILLIIQHEITPLMFDIKHKKPPFWINTFQIARKNLCCDADITQLCVAVCRREKYYTKQFSKIGRSAIETSKTQSLYVISILIDLLYKQQYASKANVVGLSYRDYHTPITNPYNLQSIYRELWTMRNWIIPHKGPFHNHWNRGLVDRMTT